MKHWNKQENKSLVIKRILKFVHKQQHQTLGQKTAVQSGSPSIDYVLKVKSVFHMHIVVITPHFFLNACVRMFFVCFFRLVWLCVCTYILHIYTLYISPCYSRFRIVSPVAFIFDFFAYANRNDAISHPHVRCRQRVYASIKAAEEFDPPGSHGAGRKVSSIFYFLFFFEFFFFFYRTESPKW